MPKHYRIILCYFPKYVKVLSLNPGVPLRYVVTLRVKMNYFKIKRIHI
jgi:hypothetical protein